MTRGRHHGELIIRIDVVATAWFVATAVAAATVFDGVILWVAALTALTLFLVGIVAFLWAFWNAVQRSRGESIAVTQLYLLLGDVAPARVRRVMLSMLAVQTLVGLGTAFVRPNAADGTPGSSLALGVLVPMFGLGLNGLWAAYHGSYEERSEPEEVRTDGPTIGQNEDHG
jgi:hypothetical protein